MIARGASIHRALDETSARLLRDLAREGVLDLLRDDGLLVGTRFVDDEGLRAALAAENPPFRDFLTHDRIEPLSYPYEWSVSMLADAAVLTLDLQERLIEHGLSLKDATAFNVQFQGAQPVFIDVTSIEKPARRDIWPALGQFGSMFTFPLMLAVHEGWDLRSYFLANPSGLPVERVARILGRTGRSRPRAWLDVTLPNLLSRRRVGEQLDVNEVLSKETGRGPEAQGFTLRRLRSKIRKLARSYRPSGVWTDYTHHCTYDAAADEAKRGHVRRYLEQHRPQTVLDLGCNTGAYSRIAKDCGARVTAIDADHDAVEMLYRDLRGAEGAILPLVVDLASPSPGIGHRNLERTPFLERARSECVLALALSHHLLATENLPLADLCALLRGLTTDHLVLEFVPTSDPMFRELLKRRVGAFDPIAETDLLEAFSPAFTLVARQQIANTQRTLLFLRVAQAQ